jgi:hypothetical protein
VVRDGSGHRYEWRADLLTVFHQNATCRPAVSSLGALLPEGRDFAAHAPRLATELGLPVRTGLPQLDDVVRRLGLRACRQPPRSASSTRS